uniref:Opioid growth factor receptor n=1 Tax=Cacopsylla melanoneura TaxID=428564 RepID=A0A8D9BK82_9HEMI
MILNVTKSTLTTSNISTTCMATNSPTLDCSSRTILKAGPRLSSIWPYYPFEFNYYSDLVSLQDFRSYDYPSDFLPPFGPYLPKYNEFYASYIKYLNKQLGKNYPYETLLFPYASVDDRITFVNYLKSQFDKCPDFWPLPNDAWTTPDKIRSLQVDIRLLEYINPSPLGDIPLVPGYNSLPDVRNPSSPLNPRNPLSPFNPSNPLSPLSPFNPNSLLNPSNPRSTFYVNNFISPLHDLSSLSPYNPHNPSSPFNPENPSSLFNPKNPLSPYYNDYSLNPLNPDSILSPYNPNSPLNPNNPLSPYNPKCNESPYNPNNPRSPYFIKEDVFRSGPIYEPDLYNPASPLNPANPHSPLNPNNPSSPLNPKNPLSPNSPLNPNNPSSNVSIFTFLYLYESCPYTNQSRRRQ